MHVRLLPSVAESVYYTTPLFMVIRSLSGNRLSVPYLVTPLWLYPPPPVPFRPIDSRA